MYIFLPLKFQVFQQWQQQKQAQFVVHISCNVIPKKDCFSYIVLFKKQFDYSHVVILMRRKKNILMISETLCISTVSLSYSQY